MLQMNARVVAAAARRALQRHVRCASAATAATGSQYARAATQQRPWQRQRGSQQTMLPVAAAFAAAAAMSATVAAVRGADCEDASANERSGYSVNPIQNVTALLRLYEEIDKNMDVFTNRMLTDLKERVDREKAENNGNLKLSPEQLALHMSIEFESTLEKVQDAVFRNNYVTKAHVTEAMQRLIAGDLPGGDPDGKITPAEAETISNYVSRLGRMRWKVTGSRQPLIPTQHKALVKDDKPDIELAVVLEVMEELIPTLTRELEAIAKALDAKDTPAAERRALISKQYVQRSGELTAALCEKRNLDIRAFQQALIFYHDDAAFEQALARLSAEQQDAFAAIGL